MHRRSFLASMATTAASACVSRASGVLAAPTSKQHAFSWVDAQKRVDINQLAISKDGKNFALQVTRPLRSPGLFAESAVPYPNLDLRGEIWLLNSAFASPRRLGPEARGVWLPCFSPDGRRLAALTVAAPGRVGFIVWDVASHHYKLFLNGNVEIHFANFSTACLAYAAPTSGLASPLKYVWLDATSILYVDHGPSPQQFLLAQSDLALTLRGFYESTRSGRTSVRVWNDRSETCGASGRLVRLSCETGHVEVLYEGDIRGVSVSPNGRLVAILVAMQAMPPVPNSVIHAPIGLTGIDEPMVTLRLVLLDLADRGGAQEIDGVMATGAVPPSRLPQWNEDSTRVVVPTRTTYSDKPSTGNDAAWEVFAATRHARRWEACSALDAELLATLLSTNGLNVQPVVDQRPKTVLSADYWVGLIKGGAWRCPSAQVLFWNAPALTLIGPSRSRTLPGGFTSVQPPVSNSGVSRTIATQADGKTLIITISADGYHMESIQAPSRWSLLGLRPDDATTIYADDTDNGTFLIVAKPDQKPRTSVLTFNTYFHNVLKPHRMMLRLPWKGGTRLGELQLPVKHKPGDRHPVIVFAYPNFEPSPDSGISRVNSSLSVTYPIQYLLANGFAFFHAPFPISSQDRANPMRAAAEAILPWLDVLDRQRYLMPGEHGFWGHSNAGYVALSLEALTDRFKAIVAWDTFPELGYENLHSSMLDVALNCAGNFLQGWRFFYEDPGEPYTPQPAPPWKNPSEYIRNEPLFNLNRAATPLLLVEGEFDVAPKEMEEVYSILRGRGVPVELAYYWGEAHVFGSPGNIHDSWRRTECFFNRYLRMK